MTAFVLVHGGFHGAWCYSRVAARLRAAGHEVFVPTLSGVGERSHLATASINLSTHVADVIAEIMFNDLNDVVLCGHSYGGMVITGAAAKIGNRIRNLFYLDACVPDDGQSLFDIAGSDITVSFLQLAAENGFLLRPLSAEHFGVNEADRAMVDALCTPHPVACFIEKVKLGGQEQLVGSRTYVRCDGYQSVNYPTYARLEHADGWKVRSLACNHDAMLDLPDGLTELLLAEA
jgi:thioesterase domain-containing protein